MSKIVGTYKTTGKFSLITDDKQIRVGDSNGSTVIISKIEKGIYKYEETFEDERIIGTGFGFLRDDAIEFVAVSTRDDGTTVSLSVKVMALECDRHPSSRQIVINVFNYTENVAVFLIGKKI